MRTATNITDRTPSRIAWVRSQLIDPVFYDVERIYDREDIAFSVAHSTHLEVLVDECCAAMDGCEILFSLIFGLKWTDDNVMVLAYHYKSNVCKLRNDDSDLLRVLKRINKLIKRGNEIRYWKKHPIGELPLFLPLKATEWENLETQYSKEKIDGLFERLTGKTRIRF